MWLTSTRSAQALLRQRVPEPDARLWAAVQSTATRPARQSASHLPLRLPVRLPAQLPNKQTWGALGAVAAIILVVVGFARLLYHPPVDQPKNPLAWHEVKLPAEFTATGTSTSIGLGPGGQTAFACSIQPNVASQVSWIWVTRDGGATWQHAAKFALMDAASASCTVLADASDFTIAVAAYNYSDGKGTTYATLDGGATWLQLPDGQTFTQLATRQGVTYALQTDAGTTDPSTSARLAVSYDRFQTWTTIDGDIVAAGQHVRDFWLVPGSDEVLAGTFGHLWASASGDGKHWVQLSSPYPAIFTAHPLADDRMMRICGFSIASSAGAPPTFCTSDEGKTWAMVPDLDHGPFCASACHSQFFFGVGSDGALLQHAVPINTKANTGQNNIVYRFGEGAGQWESLGAIPTSGAVDDVLFAPGLATNTVDSVWAFSLGVRHVADGQGIAGPGAQVYAAVYPPNASVPTPGPTEVATAMPVHPLVWRPATLPVDLTRPGALSVSPSDGATAYLCVTEASGSRTWVTRDRAAHWFPTAGLPSRTGDMPAGETFQGCAITVDDLVPTTALAQLSWNAPGNGAGFSVGGEYVTFDAGRSWRQVSIDQASYQFLQVASTGNAIYALRTTNASSIRPEYHIWASTDQMRTWRRVDTSVAENVRRFWLDPQSGEMLAQGGDVEGDWQVLGHLYVGHERGATWTQLNPPAFSFAWARWGPGHGWTICVSRITSSGDEILNCSAAGGSTWSPPAPLTIGAAQGARWDPVSLASDGALLRVMPTGKNADGTFTGYTLYRLAPGATGQWQWESLGELPGPGVSYASSPGAGVLWAVGGQGIFTADYPS